MNISLRAFGSDGIELVIGRPSVNMDAVASTVSTG